MANQEFVITQTSIQFQNDLNKIERMLEIRGLGVGLDYLVSTGIVSARTTTEATPITDPPFEIADDGGNIILRIDNDGYLYTKEFDGSDYARRSAIYQIGTGLQLSHGVLTLSSEYISLVKIYSIGAGLTLSTQGALSANVSDVTVDGVSVVASKVARILSQVKTQDTSDGAFELVDDTGNVALRITNEGHLMTSQFDSEEVGRLQRIYQIGSGLNLDLSGTLSVTTLGGVTDVRVDGISVVSNTIANVIMPVRTDEGSGAFEIADQDGNVALQITSEGHLKTKEFDSSNINILPETVNDRYLHTNATTGELEWSEVEGGESQDFKVLPTLPQPSPTAPKVVYQLLDHRLYILDMGEPLSSTAILGIAILGEMVLGIS